MRATIISCVILVIAFGICSCTGAGSTQYATSCKCTTDSLLVGPLQAIIAQQKVIIGELYRLFKRTIGTNPASEGLIQKDFETLAAQRRALRYQLRPDVIQQRCEGDQQAARQFPPRQQQPPFGRGKADGGKSPSGSASQSGSGTASGDKILGSSGSDKMDGTEVGGMDSGSPSGSMMKMNNRSGTDGGMDAEIKGSTDDITRL